MNHSPLIGHDRELADLAVGDLVDPVDAGQHLDLGERCVAERCFFPVRLGHGHGHGASEVRLRDVVDDPAENPGS